MELRLQAHGHAGKFGGRPGNLFARVRVAQHPEIRVVDDDLHADINLTLKEMLVPPRQLDIVQKIPDFAYLSEKL